MKYVAESGVYSLAQCLTMDIVFDKDNAPAIPYKEEYFRKFFDVIDDVLLNENTPRRIIGFHASYPSDDKRITDYGHWELLLMIILFSLLGARCANENVRRKLHSVFYCSSRQRFYWHSIKDFYEKYITNFAVDDFLQLPDEELDSIEKAIRPVAESAWEYTNCIDISDDEKCLAVIEKLLKNSYFMLICAPDADSSLQTAASMFGSFSKLLDKRIEDLEEGWQIYE